MFFAGPQEQRAIVQIGTGHHGFKMGQACTIETGPALLDEATGCAL
jgi:hypothetical protein